MRKDLNYLYPFSTFSVAVMVVGFSVLVADFAVVVVALVVSVLVSGFNVVVVVVVGVILTFASTCLTVSFSTGKTVVDFSVVFIISVVVMILK